MQAGNTEVSFTQLCVPCVCMMHAWVLLPSLEPMYSAMLLRHTCCLSAQMSYCFTATLLLLLLLLLVMMLLLKWFACRDDLCLVSHLRLCEILHAGFSCCLWWFNYVLLCFYVNCNLGCTLVTFFPSLLLSCDQSSVVQCLLRVSVNCAVCMLVVGFTMSANVINQLTHGASACSVVLNVLCLSLLILFYFYQMWFYVT